jgi:hypothetical protein
MKHRRNLFTAIAIVTSLLLPAAGFAQDADIPYPVRMPYRILRGTANIALGWTEVLLRPIGERDSETIGESLARASGNALTRVAAGFQDITAFWVPDMQMSELYPDWQVWPYLFHWS